MARKKLNPNIDRIVRRYKLALEKVLPIEDIIVFGSQVKGKAKSYSDIDVAVISKEFGKDRHDEGVYLSRFAEDIDLRIEPHPLNPKDLVDKWDAFAQEIKSTGIRIV